MEDSRRSTTTPTTTASSTVAVLTISNKLNCFIKQAGLFDHTTEGPLPMGFTLQNPGQGRGHSKSFRNVSQGGGSGGVVAWL